MNDCAPANAGQSCERLTRLEEQVHNVIPTVGILTDRLRNAELKIAYFCGGLAALQIVCTVVLALLKK